MISQSQPNTGGFKFVKYIVLLLLLVVAILYALPNVFGDDPSIQISTPHGESLPPTLLPQVEQDLQQGQFKIKRVDSLNPAQLLIRFNEADTQLKAYDQLKAQLGDNYVVALNIAPAVPSWLTALGAHPMPLGLDLRGGVHLTIDVDTQDLVARTLDADSQSILQALREKNIHYHGLNVNRAQQSIQLQLRNVDDMQTAAAMLLHEFPNYQVAKNELAMSLNAQFTPAALQVLTSQIVDQTMTTLRNRVNELGVSEAVVQQQGISRISVDLPGIQDSARAKEILGGTATIEFRLMDDEHDPASAQMGQIPFGSQLYTYEGRPVLLKKQVILQGKNISDARPSYSEDGRPAVSITLGNGDALFYKVTSTNVGKMLAVVFVETKTQTRNVAGETVKLHSRQEKVINIARIREALGRSFQVSGLSSDQEARDLSLLLRAGALPANMEIVEEKVVGPKLGIENIHRGMLSLVVGLSAIALFMTFYYHGFGLIANLALGLNLVFLVALLSVLGATLTFPGIAGIVLTLGMAVDANVLIFERIREELRLGISPLGSIRAGFERAFATIVDANLTTFIVAFLLFSIGTGAVKGFAVTLSLGLLTSMLTAVTYTRAIVDITHRSNVKKLSIGI